MAEARFDWTAHAARMRAAGWWTDKTIDERVSESIARYPTKNAIIACRADAPAGALPRRFTYAQLGDMVSRAAAALHRLDVNAGDVVAIQLPNWWEFAVAALACWRIGAIVNPLMPIFREREIGYMVAQGEAKVLIAPKNFRGFDHEHMIAGLRSQLPLLKHVVIVGSSADNDFEKVLLGGSDKIPRWPSPEHAPSKAMEVAILAYTSGTTGEPKGAVRCSNSVMAAIDGMARRFGHTADEVMLCCSPVGHMTGLVAVLLQALATGATVVLQDVWNAEKGVDIMVAEGVTYLAAATPFLTDICNAAAQRAEKPRLRTFLCGGAPIPPVMIERAARELDLRVSSLWGMTETLSGTLTEPSRAHEKSASTDGRPMEGMEVRIVGVEGRPLPPREVGRLMVRGASMFMGYHKRPDIPSFDSEGWFDTGDLAYDDGEGYIRIAGRTKDVLIRGGENVPVVEIENLLYKHPAIADVALVGFPDPRLGERGCVYVTLKPGAAFDLPELQRYMAECKVAKQYWPERVEIIREMPRTASGKIQKFELRERAKLFAAA